MRPVDPIDLAARLAGITPWLNEASGWASRHRHFDGPPYGRATLSFSPQTRDGRVASANFNRIAIRDGTGLTLQGLDELRALLNADGAPICFIGLMPGPQMDAARAIVEATGLTRNPWVRYPVLALTELAQPVRSTRIVARAVGRDEALAARAALGEAMWQGYEACAGMPGFHHFLAFDDERPVAHAALAVRDGLAYLGWMSTAQADRRRGAQQALIAARVVMAQALGADVIVSETITNLASSLANLQHAGFRTVYESQIYGPPPP